MYRSHYHSIELQLELTRRGIPYRVQSGVRFFEQAHIKDVISYLRIVVNPRDELAWKRVLKMVPGVGNITANRLYEQIALTVGRGELSSNAEGGKAARSGSPPYEEGVAAASADGVVLSSADESSRFSTEPG